MSKSNDKINSYGLCSNNVIDYPKKFRHIYCSICSCPKNALKNIPKPNEKNCFKKQQPCSKIPHMFYKANGNIHYLK